MRRKNFVKKKEDFVCEKCEQVVLGTGYTNHCPNCLWSRHVDSEIPGDRSSGCRGLMKPVGMGLEGGRYTLIHECIKCAEKTKNKTSKDDNFEEILKLSKTPTDNLLRG